MANFSSMALCDRKPANLEENTECYPVLQCRLSGTDLVSLVTIGLQTRTQCEGSGLSCSLCPCIALATVARSQTFILAPT